MRLIIVDEDCRVLANCIGPDEHELRMLMSDDRTRLRGRVDTVVRTLVGECTRSDSGHTSTAFVDDHSLVRVARLEGRAGTAFAVTVEASRGSDSLSRAVRKYQLTPREVEVLALILDGLSAIEVARTLQIAETTVQGYFKRLLSKTQSRNRPAMVAKVLDWVGLRRHSGG